MKRNIFLGLLMLFTCIEISAVPAFRVKKQLMLEDGTIVTATLQGDEYYGYYITDDGKVLAPAKSGKYRYMNEKTHANFKRVAYERMEKANSFRAESMRRSAPRSTQERRGLVILAQFPDVSFSKIGTQEYFNRMFNEKGFTENGCLGSVSDYFYDQSYGQLNMQFDVVGPVTLPQPLAYYGAPEEGESSGDSKVLDFAADACTAAKDLVDFSKYDWDGDGKVDNVYILFAGFSEARGADPNCLWPHQWVVHDRELVIDEVRIWNYACSNELISGGDAPVLDGIGTACHEFSHTLGLADIYNTQGGKDFVGKWDVMSIGSYIGKKWGDGTHPMAYSAFERWQLGWLEPKALNEVTTITEMKALEEEPEAYVLYNEGNTNEYYLLENRQLPKWGSPFDAHGLLVTHIDYDKGAWNNNTVNTDIYHQRYSVVGASGEFTESIDDLFPGTSGNTSFTDVTNPASTLFNANEDGTYFLHKPVENITESSDGTISFVACTNYAPCPKSIQATTNDDGTVACSWSEVEDAVSYDVELKGEYLYPSPYNNIIIEEEFTNLPKEEGTEDISGELDNYLDNPSWTGRNLYSSTNGLKINTSGVLSTPFYKISNKKAITFLTHMEPYNEDESVDTYVCIVDNKNNIIYDWDFSITKEKYNLFRFETDANKEYRIGIMAFSNPLILKGFYMYDGYYEVDDFSKEPDPSIKETLEPEIFPTTHASYLFCNLKKDYKYTVRVRAKLSDGRESLWTQPVSFIPTIATGIDEVGSDQLPSNSDSSAIYDITGRRVTSASRPGIYIKNGKKIVIGRGK